MSPFELMASFSFRSPFSSQVSKFYSLNSPKLSKNQNNNASMVNQMWHLDLLLQLQGDMFAGLLQDIVSVPISITIFHGFDFT